MVLISQQAQSLVRLRLSRDRVRALRQGYPWVYQDWLIERPSAKAGSRSILRDKNGKLLAFGMYDPTSPIAMRVCALEPDVLDDALIERRLERACRSRELLFDDSTSGYRVVNGEGDGLPGLVCDRYADYLVMKLDGQAPATFWDVEGIANWFMQRFSLKGVYQRFRNSDEGKGQLVVGRLEDESPQFQEYGLKFCANIVQGQKTGFFFDQRENRALLGKYCRNVRVLNLFGYTGGFSIYAGAAQAKMVTTVDLAKPAIQDAIRNWSLNFFPEERHEGIVADVFDYLDEARTQNRTWDVVVVDPPSFAHAEKQVEKATASYETLFTSAISRVEKGGIVALSSCSSHIKLDVFTEICRAAFAKSRRKATCLAVNGQPPDHPFPFVCNELEYLKFLLFLVD